MSCMFWLSDRYSAIWIDPSSPTIAESIGCCLLSWLALSSLSTNPPFLASIAHETQIGGRVGSTEIKTR